jgi:CheY-like chemotaxis protein
MTVERERRLAAGMDDCLAKPVHANERDAAIERRLPGHTCGEAVQTPERSDELLDGGSIAQLR